MTVDPGPQASPGQGRLVLAATPIGNLDDASGRLRALLAEADLVAAEDTRTARRLCDRLGVSPRGRIVAHHEHNEQASAAGLLEQVRSGADVVVVSDAGMPTVSDPGHRLVRAAVEQGLSVTCAPGPSAVTTALALSGLPTDRFAFDGFLPRRDAERRRVFESVRAEERTVVYFDSPQRVTASLRCLVATLGGDRPACVARELTKLHEEVVRGNADALLAWAEQREAGEGVRGEIVLVVGPATPGSGEQASEEQLVAEVEELAAGGTRMKDAVAAVAAAHGARGRDLYDAVLRSRRG